MNHWMVCNDMDYMFALMRPLKCAKCGQLDLDNSPFVLHAILLQCQGVEHDIVVV